VQQRCTANPPGSDPPVLQLHFDEGWLIACDCLAKRRLERLLRLHAPVLDAERPGEQTEVRVEQIDAELPALLAPLLDRLDQGQAAIVDEDGDNRQLFLPRAGQFHAAHQKAAVTRHGHDGPIRKSSLGSEGGG